MRLNLVTGAFGFSGSHLVKLLLENNEQVVMTDHPGVIDSDQKRRCFSSYGLDLNSPGLEIVGADLVDPKSLAELFTRPIYIDDQYGCPSVSNLFHQVKYLLYGFGITSKCVLKKF